MGTNLGVIDLGLSVNKNLFNKQLNGVAGGAKKSVLSAFKPLGKMIGGALGAAAVTGFTKSCLSLGSDLAEVQNVVDVTFKSMSSGINSFAKNAMAQFGLSETAAKKYSGTYGAMSKAMGMSESAAFEMSTAVTGLTGDVASFFNLSTDEAYTKLKSIWTGETETLKDLGVVMTQTALDSYALNNGFGKTTSNMTEQEKLLLRYKYVMSSLSDAQGDFARTQDSWANQTRILSLQFQSLKATLGQGFINVFTPILKSLNTLLAKLQAVAEAFKSFTTGLSGKKGLSNPISAAAAATGALNSGIADSENGALSSIKKVKKALAGFDEINVLDFGSATESTPALDTSGIGSVDLSGLNEANNAVDSIAEQMGTKLRASIGSASEYFKSAFGNIKKWGKVNFAPIFSKLSTEAKEQSGVLKKNLSNIFSDIQTLGDPLKNYLLGDFTNFLKTFVLNSGNIVNGIFDSFNTVFLDIWEKAVYPALEKFLIVGLPMLTQFATNTAELLGTIFGEFKKCFDLIWEDALAPFIELTTEVWCDFIDTLASFWNKWGKPIFDGIKQAVTTTSELFQKIWETILKPIFSKFTSVLKVLWKEHLQPLIAEFLDFFGVLITGAADIYNKFIAPVVGWLVDIFGPAFTKAFDIIANVVKTVFGSIFDVAKGLIKALKGVIEFLVGVFTGDWGKAWQGLKDIVGGVFDSLKTVIKTPINFIIDLINGMLSAVAGGINVVIRAINSISFDLPKALGGGHVGFDLNEVTAPQIPRLAKGGLAYQPTLAMVGDNKNARNDPEVISPLSKLQGIMSQQSGQGDARVVELLQKIYDLLLDLKLVAQFNLDGRLLEEVLIKILNKHSYMTGGR